MPGLPRLDSPLTDGHVSLREWTADDIAPMASLLDEPEIARWTRVPSPYTREHAADFLTRMEQLRGDGVELALAIVSADADQLLGSISVRVVSPENGRGELGYLVFAPARGHDVATRAVRLLARFGFERLGLGRIEIHAATGNRPSQRVAHKAGFTSEGVMRSYMDDGRGRRLDMISFSLLPGELDRSQRT